MNALNYDFSTKGTQVPNQDIESLKNITIGSQAIVSANYFINEKYNSDISALESNNVSEGMEEDINFPSMHFLRDHHASLNSFEFNLSTIEPKQEIKRQAFQRLQEWEGIVTSIDSENEVFTARLIDITNAKNPDEETDFSFDELSHDDKKMLNNGALFRWVIGYDINNGTKRKMSQIIFRRLPQWTKKDMDEADCEANELFSSLKWE